MRSWAFLEWGGKQTKLAIKPLQALVARPTCWQMAYIRTIMLGNPEVWAQ